MWNDQQYEAFRLRGYLIQKEARAKIENSGPGNYVIVRRINVTLTMPAPATTASETVCLAAPSAGPTYRWWARGSL